MFASIRKRLSYANVLATLAIFIALGGSSYAVTRLPKNSVGYIQIRQDAVRNSEIRKAAVESEEVRNGSLVGRDFKAGQLPVAAFAVVSSDGGQLKRGRDVASARESSAGRYEIVFRRDVSVCAYAATVGDPTASQEPDAGFAGAAPLVGNSKGVVVQVRDRQGEINGALDFQLVVVC